MNDVLKTIHSRRSTRGYSQAQVTEEDIKTILEAGFNAPSALNMQNWHFTVVQDKDLITSLNDEVKKKLPKEFYQSMLDRFDGDENFSVYYNAPTLIFVFGEKEAGALNCGLASQNMVLASQSLGYNTCFIGMSVLLFEDTKYYDILKAPEGYEIVSIIAVGKGNKEMIKPERDLSKVTFL